MPGAPTRRSVLAATGAGAASVAAGIATRSASGAGGYVFSKGAMGGGGFANVICAHPTQAGRVFCGGDVWGEYESLTGGGSWLPRMWGANGIGETYARACCYSQVEDACYVGTGGLKGGVGAFNACTPDGHLVARSKRIGFATSISGSPAAMMPRAVGRLIATSVVDGVETIYAAASQGLARSTDGGASWTILGATGVVWKCLCVLPDGSLLAGAYNGAVYHVSAPASTAQITKLVGAPVLHDCQVVAGQVWASGPKGVYQGLGFTPVSFFAGLNMASVTGDGETLYAGVAPHLVGKSIAVSTDGGNSWKWCPVSADQVVMLGTSKHWWLAPPVAHEAPADKSYDVSLLATPPGQPGTCYSAGRGGVWATQDSGVTWWPAMNGLCGSEVNQIRVGTVAGQAWAADTDWTGIQTADHWQTCVRTTTPGRFAAAALKRTVGGHTYQVVAGRPYRFLVDGVDQADDFFRAATVNPTDLEVTPDGWVYVGNYGGGVTVGAPL